MIGIELQQKLDSINPILNPLLGKWINAARNVPNRGRRKDWIYWVDNVGYLNYPASYVIGKMYQDHNNHLQGLLDLIKANLESLPLNSRMLVVTAMRESGIAAIVNTFSSYHHDGR